jgi:uncharacterized membrane protein
MSEPTERTGEDREVGYAVFGALAGGLALSVVLLLTGAVLTWVSGTGWPKAVPTLDQLPDEIRALRPAGFLALGLIVLMATPFLRVLSTLGISLIERDWRYVLVTGTVFAIMIASIVLGS